MTLATLSRGVRALARRTTGYEASCYDLQMTVRRGIDGWNASVRDAEGDLLYSATRRRLEDAKLTAVEFAVLRMTGALEAGTVAIVAEHLPWEEN